MRLWNILRAAFAVLMVMLFVSPLDACGRFKARRAARAGGAVQAAPVVYGGGPAVGMAAPVCNGVSCR